MKVRKIFVKNIKKNQIQNKDDIGINSNKSRTIRKSLNDGIQNLLDNNYLIEKDKDNYILE